MNERLKELARQSADGMLSYDAEGNFRLSEQEVEKFAELIVQECIVAVDIPKHLNGEAEDYFREAAQLIRNHFGVES